MFWFMPGEETPTWLNDDQLQSLLAEGERLLAEKSEPHSIQPQKLQKKVDRIIRQADKYRRNKQNESREVNKFR